jgi:cell division protein ZapA (FtsZ GTPase activity inhibitor)
VNQVPMGELNSVKITIGNRTYPIRVSKEEEGKVLEAVQAINKRLKELEDSYAVKDKQDLLAMCALQFATEAVGHHIEHDKKKVKADLTVDQVNYLSLMIDDYLAKESVPTEG